MRKALILLLIFTASLYNCTEPQPAVLEAQEPRLEPLKFTTVDDLHRELENLYTEVKNSRPMTRANIIEVQHNRLLILQELRLLIELKKYE